MPSISARGPPSPPVVLPGPVQLSWCQPKRCVRHGLRWPVPDGALVDRRPRRLRREQPRNWARPGAESALTDHSPRPEPAPSRTVGDVPRCSHGSLLVGAETDRRDEPPPARPYKGPAVSAAVRNVWRRSHSEGDGLSPVESQPSIPTASANSRASCPTVPGRCISSRTAVRANGLYRTTSTDCRMARSSR